ncbi:MAG: head GIN domain-containing protein [Planctomycetota bacterium]
MHHALFIAAAAVGLAATFTSCGIYPTVRGSGLVMTEDRPLDQSFGAIDVSGAADVVLTQGGASYLEIDCDDNLLPHILATVEGGTLRIRFEEGSYRPSVRPVYRIGTAQLSGIRLRGSTRLVAANVDAHELELRISGSGSATIDDVAAHGLDVVVSGSGGLDVGRLEADSASFTISGSGHVEAGEGSLRTLVSRTSGSGDVELSDVRVESATVRVSGSGTVRLWATESLSARVSGSGDVGFRGEPEKVSTSCSGSGDVFALR